MLNTKLPCATRTTRWAIGVFACILGISAQAWSQSAPPKTAAPKTAAPKTAPPKTAAPKTAAPKANEAPPALSADVETPRAVPPVMTFTKELITETDDNDWSKQLERIDKYKLLFRNAVLTNDTKPIVAKWAKWRMGQMTRKVNLRRLHELRSEIQQDIANAGQSKGVPTKQMLEFRYFMCDELTQRAAELLNNNFQTRLNAVILLAQLNLTEDDIKTNGILEEQAYVKAAIPLLEVISAPTGGAVDQQLEAVKIQAAIGLGRINLLGPPTDLNMNVQNQNLRNVIAKTLIAQLKDPSAHPWYQKRLIDALGSIDMVNDVLTGVPIIVKALSEVLVDRERQFCVRARAARALGRCPLPPGINTEKLVFQILLLENEMATAYQKDPDDYHWLDCFEDVYLAFHPESDLENQQYGNKRLPGLNQKNLGNLVRDAYQQMLPIASEVVNQPGWHTPKEGEERAKNHKIPDPLISNLAQWLQDHQPASHKLAPNLPDLDPTSPLPTASAGSQTSS